MSSTKFGIDAMNKSFSLKGSRGAVHEKDRALSLAGRNYTQECPCWAGAFEAGEKV